RDGAWMPPVSLWTGPRRRTDTWPPTARSGRDSGDLGGGRSAGGERLGSPGSAGRVGGRSLGARHESSVRQPGSLRGREEGCASGRGANVRTPRGGRG